MTSRLAALPTDLLRIIAFKLPYQERQLFIFLSSRFLSLPRGIAIEQPRVFFKWAARFTHVTRLQIHGCFGRELRQIPFLARLEVLRLSNIIYLSAVMPLTGFDNLRMLEGPCLDTFIQLALNHDKIEIIKVTSIRRSSLSLVIASLSQEQLKKVGLIPFEFEGVQGKMPLYQWCFTFWHLNKPIYIIQDYVILKLIHAGFDFHFSLIVDGVPTNPVHLPKVHQKPAILKALLRTFSLYFLIEEEASVRTLTSVSGFVCLRSLNYLLNEIKEESHILLLIKIAYMSDCLPFFEKHSFLVSNISFIDELERLAAFRNLKNSRQIRSLMTFKY